MDIIHKFLKNAEKKVHGCTGSGNSVIMKCVYEVSEMNNDKKARRRHQRICEVLQEQEHMQVSELCGLFHVSPATIRNDLTLLEKKQLLKRIPGGAVSTGRMPQNTIFSTRESLHMDLKEHMADYAVKHLIKEGMSVALDAGTTCYAIAKKLAESTRSCSVITYSLPVANALVHSEHVEVFLMAGRLDKQHESFHDDVALAAMKHMNSDLFFLSPNGVDPTAGITSSATDENIMKLLLHERAEATIVCADHSKFSKKAFKTICQLSQIQGILSDAALHEDIQRLYQQLGVQLYLAE